MWNEIYVGSNYRKFRRFFIKNKLPPTGIHQKFTPFFHRWTSLNLVANMASIFVTSNYCTWNPRVKTEIQIRDFFSAKPEKSKIREIKLPWTISRHTVNCERVCVSFNLSAVVSWFQQTRIRELSKFFGQESHRPPPLPTPSPKVSVRLWKPVIQFSLFASPQPQCQAEF